MEKMNKARPFTPYYINQNRLFDLYSILNRGYSEYEEITVQSSDAKKTTGKADAAASGGFKLIKISGGVEGGCEHEKMQSSGTTIKRVQTVTSILGNVLEEMSTKKYIQKICDCKQGGFFEEKVNFTLNSLKKLLDMLKDIVGLTTSISNIGITAQIPYTKKQIEDISKAFTFLFGGLEVFYETDEYAVIANLKKNCLYLSNLDDILNTELFCFGQIKKIYPNGTNLLKNTTFSKFKSAEIKNDFISKIADFSNNDTLELGITAKAEIEGKRVYEVEIISLRK